MRANGLPESIVIFKAPAPPSSSWWVSLSPEAFKAAHDQQVARLTRLNCAVPGQNRIVGTTEKKR